MMKILLKILVAPFALALSLLAALLVFLFDICAFLLFAARDADPARRRHQARDRRLSGPVRQRRDRVRPHQAGTGEIYGLYLYEKRRRVLPDSHYRKRDESREPDGFRLFRWSAGACCPAGPGDGQCGLGSARERGTRTERFRLGKRNHGPGFRAGRITAKTPPILRWAVFL